MKTATSYRIPRFQITHSIEIPLALEGVHLTLPPHIFSVQVKSRACWITGQWGRAQNKIKET